MDNMKVGLVEETLVFFSNKKDNIKEISSEELKKMMAEDPKIQEQAKDVFHSILSAYGIQVRN